MMSVKYLVLSVVLASGCQNAVTSDSRMSSNGPATPNADERNGEDPIPNREDPTPTDEEPKGDDPNGECPTDEAPTCSAIDVVPPTQPELLFSFLKENKYQDMVAEPAVHPSFGPHDDVRVFINQRLADSLASGAESHPLGAAAIKELYDDAGELSGWAVEVKVATTGGKDAWYWYENFSTETNAPVVDGTGETGCTGCHGFGTDFVTTMPSSFGL